MLIQHTLGEEVKVVEQALKVKDLRARWGVLFQELQVSLESRPTVDGSLLYPIVQKALRSM